MRLRFIGVCHGINELFPPKDEEQRQERRLHNRLHYSSSGIDIWCCHMASKGGCTTYGGGCIEYMDWRWHTNGK